MSNTFARFVPDPEHMGTDQVRSMTVTAFVGREATKHSRKNIQLTFGIKDTWESKYITLSGFQVEALMGMLLKRISGEISATGYTEPRTYYKDHSIKGDVITC